MYHRNVVREFYRQVAVSLLLCRCRSNFTLLPLVAVLVRTGKYISVSALYTNCLDYTQLVQVAQSKVLRLVYDDGVYIWYVYAILHN